MLSRSEGPLWVGVRGRGLAYGASLRVLTGTGQLCLSLSDVSDPAAALAAARDAMAAFVSGLPGPDGHGPDPASCPFSSAEGMRAVAEARAALLFGHHARLATAAGVLSQVAPTRILSHVT